MFPITRMRSPHAFVSSATVFAFLAGICLGSAGTSARADLRGSGLFPDVPQGSYYDDAIGTMYDEGIITGYANGKFGPDDPVTRGQIAVIMQRLMEQIGALEGSSSSRSRSSTSSTAQSSSEDEEEDDGTLNTHGAFRFTIAQFNVSESSTKASVTVVRTEGDAGSVKVEYETQDDTAKAGEDYTANSGTLDFADGETSKTISVTLKNDDAGESAEAFKVVLKNPTGGSELGDTAAVTITVLDNDGGASGTSSSTSSVASAGAAGALQFGAAAFAVAERTGTLTVTVERVSGTKGQVTVAYATKNGTGEAGTHYQSTNGTLTFADGETQKTFAVTVVDNSEAKGNKTFTMTLSQPTGGAVLGQYSSATATVIDDESIATGTGTIRLKDDGMEATEGEGLAIAVSRAGGTQGEVTVKYETIAGTAQAGADFTATSGTLTFRAGESEKVVTVPILADTTVGENEEKFTFRISDPSAHATLGSPNSASISIFE